MATSTVYIVQTADETWSVALGHFEQLLADVIKRTVPYDSRFWDRDLKEWLIEGAEHANALRTVFTILGCQVCDWFRPGRCPDTFADFLAAIDDDAATL